VTAAAPLYTTFPGAALKGYGELIIIKHDETHLSAYGHNRRRLVGEGVTVAAGQPIAELGLGPEQKPLLHFEVRRRGKPVDPLAYLPAR
jgi:lipoprotein NlpD